MKKKLKCQICKKKIILKNVTTRSNKKLKINFCTSCDFEYFIKEKTNNLKQNKLDIFRLKNVGLKLIEKKKDIINGTQQAKEYIKLHANGKKKLKILDIGCSWGYFLKECKKNGHKAFGIEINKIRKDYVNNILNIKCLSNINELSGLTFDKIFLFYSLEYIKNPQDFLLKLKQFLSKNGEIIVYTPNKNDHINQLLNLKSYNNFFYEENSINYFSKKTLIKIGQNIKCKFNIQLYQGYSIINLLNWFFHKKPFSTGYVGKDYYIENLLSHLKSNLKKNKKLKSNFGTLIKKIDSEFKKLISKKNISNTIIFRIKWK